MSRRSGSKMVALAVTATVTALGIGTIYLPFIADKDRVRGLHEEGEMTASERRAYEDMLHKMQAAQEKGNDKPMPTSNSMWSAMNRAAAASKDK